MKLGYMSREALELGSDRAIWYVGLICVSDTLAAD